MARTMNMGVIGVGARGSYHAAFITNFPGVHVSAVCDIYADKAEKTADKVEAKAHYRPDVYTDYHELLKDESIEAVLIAADWELHIPIAIDAMKAGKWVVLEVGPAFTVESCWDLVHTSEETGIPVMFLENCCYGKRELMIANMARRGVLGRIVHCEGGYRHDLRDEVADGDKNRHYRLHNYMHRNAHNYPTHDFGPIAKILGINRGNCMLTLSSTASGSFGVEDFIKRKRPEYDYLQDVDFAQGDVVTTVIRCAGGETVTLTLDTSLPRYYSRDFTVQGTRGMYIEQSDTIYMEDNPKQNHNASLFSHCGEAAWYDHKYLSPKWRPENADKVIGGHGGMDGMAWSDFFDHLERRDKNFNIDVYDAAAWMVIGALSAESISRGGMPVAVPDFTNGAWMKRPPRDCDDFTCPLPEDEEPAENTAEKKETLVGY